MPNLEEENYREQVRAYGLRMSQMQLIVDKYQAIGKDALECNDKKHPLVKIETLFKVSEMHNRPIGFANQELLRLYAQVIEFYAQHEFGLETSRRILEKLSGWNNEQSCYQLTDSIEELNIKSKIKSTLDKDAFAQCQGNLNLGLNKGIEDVLWNLGTKEIPLLPYSRAAACAIQVMKYSQKGILMNLPTIIDGVSVEYLYENQVKEPLITLRINPSK